MAVDKNSKAYQSLLSSGYTDEQISQMHDQLASGQSAQSVVNGQPPRAQNVDQSTYDGTDGKGNVTVGPQNANLNYNQYGDDSNPNQQNQRGGLNDKYTGEGVSNTYIDYNPNLRLGDLDPNYLYGDAARQQNRKEAGYIARRNDQIASALYNEGLVGREDVANWLGQQKEWMNSTEEDRLNTIESVWKRLGQIKPQEEEKPDPSKADEILSDTSGKLYGKTTADEGEPSQGIDTLADANSVFRAMEESRVANLKSFIAMNPSDIAELIVSGTSPFSEQTLRDAQQYYPEFMAQVNVEKKKKIGQQNVNAMTSGKYDYVTSDMESKKGNIESSIDAMSKEYSSNSEQSESTKQDIESSIATNQTASEANKTMEAIEKEAAQLKNRLKNLREEANRVFKGDVPDYMVNAYMNNKSQEIQNQLSILEDRYNAAYQRYTTELDQERKEKQYNLQLKQFQLQKDNAEFNKWYQKQQLDKSNYTTDENGNVRHLTTDENGNVYYEKVEKVQTYSGSGMKGAGLKNNNPGNIKDSDFGNVLGHDERGFAKFATPEDGFDALVEKIIFNQTNPKSKYYGTTLLEYFQIYAPKGDGNDPIAYAQSVAKQLGVGVNTPIKDVDPVKLAAAIAKHDSGYDYSTYGQFRTSTGTSTGANFNIDDVEIPWSIFEDETTGMTIDPKSEEGQKRIMEYLAPYVMQNVDLNNTSYNEGPLSDDGITPVAYRQRIYQLVPGQLKNNVAELENLYATARVLYQAGYTADQAALTFYGLDLKNDKTGLMQSLVDLARSAGVQLSDEFYGNLGSFTERGLTGASIKMVENEILPEEQRKEIAKYTSMLQKIQNVRESLTNASKVGPIEGKLSKLLNQWWKADEEYQKAATAIDVAFSQLRNSLLGSAITETEKKTYENLFPTTDDFYENILTKLEQSEDGLITDINSIRNSYGLPILSDTVGVDGMVVDAVDMALNPSLRYVLYKSSINVFG